MTMSLSADSTTTTTIMARPGPHNQSQGPHVHKRRLSRDSDDELLAAAASTREDSPSHIPPRPRMISAPSGYGQHTRSASGSNSQNHNHILPRPTLQRPPGLPLLSPVRTSFHMAPPPNGVQPNGHSRARSISAFTYSPLAPSPLSASIQANNNGVPSTSSLGPKTLPARMQTSYSAPEIEGSSSGDANTESLRRQTPEPSRRSHNRIHSRNLSIFFPRPGSLPTSTISELEDGTQEVLIPGPSPVEEESGRTAESRESFSGNSRSGHMRKPLSPFGQGFTFGSKPPPSISGTEYPSINPSQADRPRPISPPLTVTRTRRGHHHKHSLSHNFFSFLEPGYTSVPSSSPGSSPGNDSVEPESNAQSTLVPASSWETKLNSGTTSYNNGYSYDSLPHHPPPLVISPTFAKALSITNLSLGATLWVSGQQAGSLACTGLGYWVVYDAIGLALSRNFDFGLGSIVSRLEGGATVNHKNREAVRRPYGAARLSTLLTFAQSVYLMFSAVYVCKETIEHVLLSAGEAQGHHHHPGDETSGTGLELPLILTSITFFSLLGSALLFDSNSRIVNVTQTRIPSLPVLLLRTIRSFTSLSDSQNYHHHRTPSPSRSRLTNALSNPFVLSPLIFCMGILVIGILVSSPHQRLIDLLLASLIAFVTFKLAYRACVILGTVLLQTSPARATVEKGRVKTSGKEGEMEAFLRAMREVERHPHVLHLPAPHIWQIAPGSSSLTTTTTTSSSSSSPSHSKNETSNLVVTLELHVRAELGDEDVLELTRWAWERVVIALGGSLTKMSPSPGERKLEGIGNWVDERLEDVDEGGGPEVTVGIVRG